jgi:hypothetical protein
MYVNGAAVATNTNMSIHPAALGNTTQNYLGDSQYASDPSLRGRIDDFRMYGIALPAQQVLQLARPFIVTPAAASDNPVTTTSTSLSVLAADLTAGESALTHTWSTTGSPPAPVMFSANGTNAAKNTTATFTQTGVYQFLVTIVNPAAGLSTISTTSVIVGQPPPGDYNLNGVVDAADYTVWRDTLGSTMDLRANGDNTGASANRIDQADFNVWRNHFGEMLSLAGSGAASGSIVDLVPAASLQSVAANDPITASQPLALPAGDAALASAVSIAPTSSWAEPWVDRPWQVAVARTRSGASVVAVRQDSALLAWLASRTEGMPRHDDLAVVGFVDDRAATKSTDSRFDAVDEVFEALSIMPAVGSHQLVSA